MRFILLFGVFLTFSSLQAQLSVGLSYYQDSTNFSPVSNDFDASDLITTSDEFLRFSASCDFLDFYQINGWMDLNSGLFPQNFKWGFRRAFKKGFFVEAVARNIKYWIPYYDNRFRLDDSYDDYNSVFQLGMESGFTWSYSRLAVEASANYLFGTRGAGKIEYYMPMDNTNFRGVDSYSYRIDGFRTINLKGSVGFSIFKLPQSSLSLQYQIVWRQDSFSFESEQTRYRWTRNDPEFFEKTTLKQTGLAIQHHIGIVFKRN